MEMYQKYIFLNFKTSFIVFLANIFPYFVFAIPFEKFGAELNYFTWFRISFFAFPYLVKSTKQSWQYTKHS